MTAISWSRTFTMSYLLEQCIRSLPLSTPILFSSCLPLQHILFGLPFPLYCYAAILFSLIYTLFYISATAIFLCFIFSASVPCFICRLCCYILFSLIFDVRHILFSLFAILVSRSLCCYTLFYTASPAHTSFSSCSNNIS